MTFDPNSLTSFPSQTGVYLMKDPSGRVLYIGKAKNIKSRLRQYFSLTDQRAMIPFLIKQIATIETLVVPTEKEALLLENTLIKRHQPKYNILLKDDKTYISLMVTDHKWPQIELVRLTDKVKKGKRKFFGPYTNGRAARKTLDLILHLFPLRQCSDAEFSSRKRPCILYDMKKCLAPCVGKCTHADYLHEVKKATDLLKGQDKKVISYLKQEMKKAAEGLAFEKAQDLLEQIKHIEHILQIQHVDNPHAKNSDVFGLHMEGSDAMIAKLIFREGKLIGSAHFSFTEIVSSPEEVLESFLLQHYRDNLSIPSQIYVSEGLEHQKEIEEILSEEAKKTISLSTPTRGRKKELTQMALSNAKTLFIQEKDQRALQDKLLLQLQETLHLHRYPRLIECFDSSNMAQENAVAAMVTYVNGKRDKKKTKLFKIKTTQKGDVPALNHVLERHLTRAKAENHFCDLLIVDGAKGQLNGALEVLKSLNIASIDVIGVAKEEGRHDKGITQEQIFLAGEKEPLILSSRSPLLFLLQRIRDDAHMAAISYHRKKRSSALFQSALDRIPGIGPKKKKALLQHFGSVARIQNASESELEELSFLSQKDIENLLKGF